LSKGDNTLRRDNRDAPRRLSRIGQFSVFGFQFSDAARERAAHTSDARSANRKLKTENRKLKTLPSLTTRARGG
jgi:hypothetical protein